MLTAAIAGAAASLFAQAPEDASTRAADRLASLQKEAESLARQEQTLLVELQKLEVERQIKTEEVAAIDRDTADVQDRLAAAQARAAALEQEAAKQRPEIDARLVELYKMGRAGYWRMLLDVNSLHDLGRAYRTAAALGRIDRDRVEEHRRTLAQLATERSQLRARSHDLQQLRARSELARAAAARAVTARGALVKSIDARRDLNAQLTGELQEAQQKLHATVNQLAGAKAAALPIRPFQGALPWPAEGLLSGRFGSGDRRGVAPRQGIDISLPEGRPVRAVHEGTVAYADTFTGYGRLVIIDHGAQAYSLYGYLAEVSVKKGDRVEAGAVVGLSGRNPSGNPSLYFELRVDGKAVDPVQWLKKP